MMRSAKSHDVAALPAGARGGLRHHRGTTKVPIFIDGGAPIKALYYMGLFNWSYSLVRCLIRGVPLGYLAWSLGPCFECLRRLANLLGKLGKRLPEAMRVKIGQARPRKGILENGTDRRALLQLFRSSPTASK
jgi:hypothetical protein